MELHTLDGGVILHAELIYRGDGARAQHNLVVVFVILHLAAHHNAGALAERVERLALLRVLQQLERDGAGVIGDVDGIDLAALVAREARLHREDLAPHGRASGIRRNVVERLQAHAAHAAEHLFHRLRHDGGPECGAAAHGDDGRHTVAPRLRRTACADALRRGRLCAGCRLPLMRRGAAHHALILGHLVLRSLAAQLLLRVALTLKIGGALAVHLGDAVEIHSHGEAEFLGDHAAHEPVHMALAHEIRAAVRQGDDDLSVLQPGSRVGERAVDARVSPLHLAHEAGQVIGAEGIRRKFRAQPGVLQLRGRRARHALFRLIEVGPVHQHGKQDGGGDAAGGGIHLQGSDLALCHRFRQLRRVQKRLKELAEGFVHGTAPSFPEPGSSRFTVFRSRASARPPAGPPAPCAGSVLSGRAGPPPCRRRCRRPLRALPRGRSPHSPSRPP